MLDEVLDEASLVGSGLVIEDDDEDDQCMRGILALRNSSVGTQRLPIRSVISTQKDAE